MDGRKTAVTDLFFLLAGLRLPLETMKREYIRAVYSRTKSIVDTAKILQVDRALVRKHLK